MNMNWESPVESCNEEAGQGKKVEGHKNNKDIQTVLTKQPFVQKIPIYLAKDAAESWKFLLLACCQSKQALN